MKVNFIQQIHQTQQNRRTVPEHPPNALNQINSLHAPTQKTSSAKNPKKATQIRLWQQKVSYFPIFII